MAEDSPIDAEAELQRIQSLQKESEERLHLAMQAAQMGTWDWNLDTGEWLWKPDNARMYGLDPQQQIGSYEDLIGSLHEDDRARVAQALKDAIDSQQDFSAEMRAVHSDGSVHWISGAGRAFYDESGKAVRMIGVVQDITARRASEDALAASEERLRLMVENVREYAIFATDLERRVQIWNSGAERLLGFSENEILGHSADIIFTEEDRAANACLKEAETALAHGRASDERWHMRKDGSRFWGSGVMMAMHDAQGRSVGFVKIFRDQTEERRAKQELENSRSDLLKALGENEQVRQEIEAASRAKDHFLAILSHELRAPLSPVSMTTDRLLRKTDLDAGVRKGLDMIRRNIDTECRLIDDLLDMTRIIRGKMEIVQETFDLHDAIQGAAEVAAAEMEAKEQSFSVSLEAKDSQVIGDAMRLQQATWNLLRNASKFTPRGGRISLKTRNEGKRIIVEINDSGIGIGPDKLQMIFEAFSQADAGVGRQFGGLGLGLAITKAIVDAHGGQIWAESAGFDQGASLILELPLIS